MTRARDSALASQTSDANAPGASEVSKLNALVGSFQTMVVAKDTEIYDARRETSRMSTSMNWLGLPTQRAVRSSVHWSSVSTAQTPATTWGKGKPVLWPCWWRSGKRTWSFSTRSSVQPRERISKS